jgi:phosphopentomutase
VTSDVNTGTKNRYAKKAVFIGMKFERICCIVLDSVGIGELPDAEQYGDRGANTLVSIAKHAGHLRLPNMARLGLGNIAPIPAVEPAERPEACYGKMAEISAGKDTMTGHWELMGLHVRKSFRTYPDGFPQSLLEKFQQATGRPVIGNKPASGTAIIAELGEEQMRTGAWIVYTSADSVMQIAAHEEVIPLQELYQACEIARALTLEEPDRIGRVIARPFAGSPGRFVRTANRRDYALDPPEPTVLNLLQDAGWDTISIGKINDIFNGSGIGRSVPTKNNEDGIRRTIEWLEQPFRGLLFVNLVDFDQQYGHRRDPCGYAEALERWDRALPELLSKIGTEDLLIITADHGNDPAHTGTDHTREYVPLLVYSPAIRRGSSLGVRPTFADVGATIADNFRVGPPRHGTSFLSRLPSA